MWLLQNIKQCLVWQKLSPICNKCYQSVNSKIVYISFQIDMTLCFRRIWIFIILQEKVSLFIIFDNKMWNSSGNFRVVVSNCKLILFKINCEKLYRIKPLIENLLQNVYFEVVYKKSYSKQNLQSILKNSGQYGFQSS